MMEITWLVLAYLFGSVNNGIIVSRMIHKHDVRDFGSNNAGSTNMLRTFGMKSAAIVFILDILKPIIPFVLCTWLTPTAFDFIIGGKAWIALFAIIGQCYPLYFGFKGGKGAASTLGMMLVCYPYSVIFGVVVFISTVFFSKYVSLATLLGISITALVNIYFYPQTMLPYFITVLLLFWRHRANIKRLLTHTESKTTFKKH